MRCQDVTQELAAPSGRVDREQIARHLATCAKCTAWARSALELDQAWEVTRPEEPTADVFDSVWAGVCRRLDSAPAKVEVKPGLLRAWRHWALPITSVAATALVGFFVLKQNQGEPRPMGAPLVLEHGSAVPVPRVDLQKIDIEVSGDRLIVITIEAGSGKPKVESLSPAEGLNPTQVADNFEILNHAETMGLE